MWYYKTTFVISLLYIIVSLLTVIDSLWQFFTPWKVSRKDLTRPVTFVNRLSLWLASQSAYLAKAYIAASAGKQWAGLATISDPEVRGRLVDLAAWKAAKKGGPDGIA